VKAPFGSSVQIVVWSTTKRKSRSKVSTETSLALRDECTASKNRNLFLVNQAKRKLDVPSIPNEKPYKKRNKPVEFVTEGPHNSATNSVSKRRSGQVKLSKPEEYKRYIRSYISSRQRVSKGQKVSFNIIDYIVGHYEKRPIPPAVVTVASRHSSLVEYFWGIVWEDFFSGVI
jgi:hypothetical protein